MCLWKVNIYFIAISFVQNFVKYLKKKSISNWWKMNCFIHSEHEHRTTMCWLFKWLQYMEWGLQPLHDVGFSAGGGKVILLKKKTFYIYLLCCFICSFMNEENIGCVWCWDVPKTVFRVFGWKWTFDFVGGWVWIQIQKSDLLRKDR